MITSVSLTCSINTPFRNDSILLPRVSKTQAAAHTVPGAITNMTVADRLTCDIQSHKTFLTASGAAFRNAPPSFEHTVLMQLLYLPDIPRPKHTNPKRQVAMTLILSSLPNAKHSHYTIYMLITRHERTFPSHMRQTFKMTPTYFCFVVCANGLSCRPLEKPLSMNFATNFLHLVSTRYRSDHTALGVAHYQQSAATTTLQTLRISKNHAAKIHTRQKAYLSYYLLRYPRLTQTRSRICTRIDARQRLGPLSPFFLRRRLARDIYNNPIHVAASTSY